ncbi:reverse transcriptase domain-containing protein [Tanacetum coccineum]
MTPICEYLTKEILPEDKKKARTVHRKASRYAVINGTLYKNPSWDRGFGVLDHFKPITSLEKYMKDPAACTPVLDSAYLGRLYQITESSFVTTHSSKDYDEKLCITLLFFASVKHPQTNGLVERANRSLGEGIKGRLDERSKDWMGELSHVLWAHCTMIKSSNGETPFSLTYGTEVVILAEIGMPTLRTTEIDLIKNVEALEINLDLIEEKREHATIQEAKSKAKIEKYYNSKVRDTSFKPGDMVYRSNDVSHAKDGGKLGPKWEGPYEVTESLGKGSFKLKECNGNELPGTWNIRNLKKCYVHEV